MSNGWRKCLYRDLLRRQMSTSTFFEGNSGMLGCLGFRSETNPKKIKESGMQQVEQEVEKGK